MSVNVYNPQTGLLSAVASSNRVWTGTKAQFEAAQQAGTLPLNSVLFITDDEEDYPIGNTDISEIGDGTITGAIAYLSEHSGGGGAMKSKIAFSGSMNETTQTITLSSIGVTVNSADDYYLIINHRGNDFQLSSITKSETSFTIARASASSTPSIVVQIVYTPAS